PRHLRACPTRRSSDLGEVLTELAQRLTLAHGITAEVRSVDLADRTQRAGLVDELAVRDIAILCNNAGIATFGPVAELDFAYERRSEEHTSELQSRENL